MNSRAYWVTLLILWLAACGHSTLFYTVADGDGDTDVDADVDVDVDGDSDCDPPCLWENCEECLFGDCVSYCDEDE